jgi:peptidoglycan lytic transglycosylase
MKSRVPLAIITALCLLSALVGLAVLLYVYVRGTPSSVSPVDTLAAVTAEMASILSPTVAPLSISTPLPELTMPTSTYTPSPTPSLTFSPTPSATPSPTPGPAARMINAHRAKKNGDYRLARSEFQAVLDAPYEDRDTAEALYELGVCTFLDGESEAALKLLRQFVADHPQDHRVSAAHYYLAEALEALADYRGAIEHYRTYLGMQDVLADIVYTQIGHNWAALGEYEQAAASYEQALEFAPDLEQEHDLREQIGITYSAWGRYDTAIEWLQTITERSENVYRLARIWYLIGQVHRLAGREAEALDAFAQAVYGDPRPGYAHSALVAMLDVDEEVDEFQRGLIDYHAESYGAAIAALSRYMANTPDYSSDVHYYLALSYIDTGAYDMAVQECEKALSRYPETIPHWGELWLLRAQALGRQDRAGDAVAAYLEFADANPGHSLAPPARWEAAELLEGEGQFSAAADVYTALADTHVDADLAPQARYQAGLSRYRDGDHDAALVAWRELVNDYPDASKARSGRYWLGKVLWAQGAEAEARSILQELADQYPRDYYGLRAAQLLGHDGQLFSWPAAPAGIHLTSDEATERREAERWLRDWADLPENIELGTIPVELADDVRFRRGMELLAVGRQAKARDEFEGLRKDADQDPAALFRLGRLTRDLGLYAQSIRATIDLIVLAPEDSVLDMPRMIQRLAFPVYFSDLVLAESEEYGIDPLLMFALIRQESVFDDQVTSWAGAVGLAQIMPATGEWIAELMPWPEYQQESLLRAHLNAKFGIWFMSRILKMTEGNIAAALAGYNGGPGNGVAWLAASGGDPDLLIEVIHYDEPQQYVRQIYRHYDVYTRLYGAQFN